MSGKALVSHHTPDEPKARALVLSAEGHSSEAVGEMVGVSGRTVLRWVKRCREVSRNKETPEILDDWARIVRRAQGMMHSVLDQAEALAEIASNDHPGPLAIIARIVAAKEISKGAVTWNIYAGTGTDKLQKEHNPDPPRLEYPDQLRGAGTPQGTPRRGRWGRLSGRETAPSRWDYGRGDDRYRGTGTMDARLGVGTGKS